VSSQANRRDELLALAARMFAERGLRATTVRDIADAAGMLSGSLYHHFAAKESMADEILRSFLDPLFARYEEIRDARLGPRQTLEALVLASFEAVDQQHDAAAIYQAEARRLANQPGFEYIPQRLAEFRQLWRDVLSAGVADGSFRPDLDVDLAYRFLRDTVWVSVHWYRPAGPLPIETVAKQYLSIVLDGMAARRRPVRSRKGDTR
jgi:AcrR family transcriptional regulator